MPAIGPPRRRTGNAQHEGPRVRAFVPILDRSMRASRSPPARSPSGSSSARFGRPRQSYRAESTTLLCGLVVLLEGYNLSALGYVVPQLVGIWHRPPVAFTAALTASNVGMFGGAVVCGWLGDRYGRKPVLLGCIAAFGTASLLTRVRHRYHPARARTPGHRCRPRRRHPGVHRAGVRRQPTAPPRHARHHDDYGRGGRESRRRHRGRPHAVVVRLAVRVHRRRPRAAPAAAAGRDVPARIRGVPGDPLGRGGEASRRRRPPAAARALFAHGHCRSDVTAVGDQLPQPAHDLLRQLVAAVAASQHGSDV